MNLKQKRGLCLLLLLLLLCGTCLPAAAAVTDTQLRSAVQQSAVYMQKTVPNPQVGSIGGEWAVLGLARSDAAVPQSYWDNYYSNLENYVKAHNGVLHTRKYTEYSRVVLALTAIGKEPSNVAGYNLLTPLGDYDKTIQQGINGPIWALLALDSGNYAMPVNAAAKTQATRQMYVDEILSRQLDNGGWSLTAKGGVGQASADVTGMVLQALANYQQQEKVKAAIDKALTCLSRMQQADGGFGDNVESVAQVLVGLCALDIDGKDSRFVKEDHTVLDALLSYRQADGSFLHIRKGTGNNQMAAEQGLYAMVAAQRMAEGKSSLYDMRGSDKQSAADKPDAKTDAAVKSNIAVKELSAAEKEVLQKSGAVLFHNLCGNPYFW